MSLENHKMRRQLRPFLAPNPPSVSAASARKAQVSSARGASCERNEVTIFLRQIGLEQYGPILIRNGFDDMETLVMLEEDLMKDMGLPIGHILKLKKKIKDVSTLDDQAATADYLAYTASRADIAKDGNNECRKEAKEATGYKRSASLKLNGQLKGELAVAVPRSPQPVAEPVPQASPGSLSHEMIDSVKASWQLVCALGLEKVAGILYKKLFEVAPVTKELFPLSVRMRHRDWASPKEEDPDDPSDSPALPKLFCKVLEAVGTAVAGLQDMKSLVPHLTALGMRHINYNMKAEYFQYGGEAVMLTLKIGLGDLFTRDVELAWRMVYDFVSATIVTGLHMAQAREAELKVLLAERSASQVSTPSVRESLPDRSRSAIDLPKALSQPEEEFPPLCKVEYQRQPSLQKNIMSVTAQPSCQAPKDEFEYQQTNDWHWTGAQETEKSASFQPLRRQPQEKSEMPTLLTAFAAEIRSRVCR